MTLQEALIILGDSVKANGDIYDLSVYMSYTKGYSTITLDGDFGAEELEALAVYMRNFEKPAA